MKLYIFYTDDGGSLEYECENNHQASLMGETGDSIVKVTDLNDRVIWEVGDCVSNKDMVQVFKNRGKADFNRSQFKKKADNVKDLAEVEGWLFVGEDKNNYRVSFERRRYRVDIYLGKMTICIIPKGGKSVFLKGSNLGVFAGVLKRPVAYSRK